MQPIFILSLFASFFITACLIPLTIRFAKKYQLIDDPKKRVHPAAVHTKPIPRAGGLAIYLGILGASLIFLPFDRIFGSILFAGALVVIVGLLDDKYDLSPYLRFLTNIFAASFVVFQGITVPYITNPFGGFLEFANMQISLFGMSVFSLPAILAIVWIVWVMNMLNWSKGVDGQMPGIAAVAAIVIGIASLRFDTLAMLNIHTAVLAFIVAGASLGFLLFNVYPARIFPGYSATILGFVIGILAILSSVKLATALLVMGVPAADALFTVVRRVLSKKSPFWHDRGHLHHHLLNLGWGHRQIAFFYWSVSVLLGVIALNLSSKGKLFVIILVLVMVTGGIIGLKIFLKQKHT